MIKSVSVVPPGDYPEPLNVIGTEVFPLLVRARTGGPEVTVQRGGEGHGPPLHRHDWDECFFVLEGSVVFMLEDRTLDCVPGTLVHVPAGNVHGFRYGAGGGRILEFTGTNSGAVSTFTDLDASVPPGPPDIPAVLAALARNGVIVAG